MGNARLAISAGFLAAIMAVVAFSGGLRADLHLVLFLSACAMIPLLVPRREKTYRSRDSAVRVKKMSVQSVPAALAALDRTGPMRALKAFLESMISSRVPAMGSAYDAERNAAMSLRIAVLSAAPCAALGIWLALNVHPGLATLGGAPFVIFFAPVLTLKFGTVERRSRIEEEMAYFLCYVNIMQTVGVGLYKAFESIRDGAVFPGMGSDSKEIIKRVRFLGQTQNESMIAYAESHPSEQFRNYISGYIAKITSVGDVPAYTESKALQFFDDYIAKWERYEKSAGDIFGAIIMIAVVMPMMMGFNAMLGSGASAGTMLFLGAIIPPMVSVGLVVMLNSSQPTTGSSYSMSYVGLAAGAAVGALCLLAGLDGATCLAAGAVVGAAANHGIMKSRIGAARAVDAMMPEFMRDVTEMSKSGQNISQIVLRQSRGRAYSGAFNRILADLSGKISSGMPFDEAAMQVRVRSSYVRFIMFLLARTYSTGGGSTEIFHGITEFCTKIQQTKAKIQKNLSLMTAIVYFSPFLMLGIMHMMTSMFSGIDAPDTGSIFTFSVDESFTEHVSTMAITTSVAMGVVASKIANLTVKNTLPVAISGTSALIAIELTPHIAAMTGF